jgi:uroporphyrinogen decarboxylase
VNSRERVRRAIAFEKPDRVPYVGFTLATDLFPMIQLTPSSWQPKEPYMPYVSSLELALRLWRSKRKLPKGWIQTKHQAIDEWGIVWERFGTFTTQGQVIEPAIKTWDDLPNLKVPDPRDPARYSTFTKLGKLLGGKKFKTGSLAGHFLFEMFHFLRGWENSMRDIVRPPKQAGELLDTLCDFYLAIADEWIQRGVDGIMIVDDLGGQREPLLSPRAFQSLFLPRYKRIIDYCHDHGKPVILHSCGDVREIMPLLVDAGLDVFQFDSPDMTGIEWCSEHFGGKVAFMDVVDIQNVIPAGKGTLDDVVKYTKRLIYNLGRFDGGLLLNQYPTPGDLRPQKGAFKVMQQACKQFGKYPLDLQRLKE